MTIQNYAQKFLLFKYTHVCVHTHTHREPGKMLNKCPQTRTGLKNATKITHQKEQEYSRIKLTSRRARLNDWFASDFKYMETTSEQSILGLLRRKDLEGLRLEGGGY